MSAGSIDFEHLLKLRVVVARFGEMDMAKWWNSRGQLGRLGAAALKRGFPRTYRFAQARSVFSIAAHRCSEIFSPPSSVSLWHLPETLEEEFNSRWERWLEQAETWAPFFERVETLQLKELSSILQDFSLVTEGELTAYTRLRRTAEGRAVPLSSPFTGTQADLSLLALGFGRGEPSALAVPYATMVRT